MKVLLLILAVFATAQAGLIPEINDEHKPEAYIDPSEVTFHFYSRANPDQPQQIYIGNMNNVNMDFSKPIKFIVHGYTQTGRAPWIMDFKEKYLLVKDVNIISVDWESPASGPFYDNAKQRTKPTGHVIGQFMDYLSTQGADESLMHCIGFSLGAHACGVAGKNLTSARLGRVTGLDPALPLYDYEDTTETMKAEDAAFVDVIHTCGGWLAFHHPLGHADFYPNDGTSEQPGCELEVTGECSHDRSHEVFAESIMASTFVSLLCDSWDMYRRGECDFNDETPMGEPASTSARGKYWLETRGRSPFAMG